MMMRFECHLDGYFGMQHAQTITALFRAWPLLEVRSKRSRLVVKVSPLGLGLAHNLGYSDQLVDFLESS